LVGKLKFIIPMADYLEFLDRNKPKHKKMQQAKRPEETQTRQLSVTEQKNELLMRLGLLKRTVEVKK